MFLGRVSSITLQILVVMELVPGQDPTATPHFQVIWLLARGHTIADVAAVTSFVPRWIEQLLARYNAHGPDALGDLAQ